MKEKLSNIGVYLKVGFIGLGYLVLRAGINSGNNLFSIAGIIIIAVVGIVLLGNFFYKKKVTEIANIKQNTLLEEFKRSSRQIKVNLESLNIISNSWREDVIVNVYKYGGLDELAGYKNHNIISVDRNLNTILLEIPVKNKIYKYQISIESDLTTLQMKFAIQKETTLFINSETKETYLDLEFLDK